MTSHSQAPILNRTSQIAIRLPAELDEFVQSAVAAGDYSGPNELVAYALYAYRDRAWQE